jgi:DNA-binding NtrC family response regulator
METKAAIVILLVEPDVIVRFALAEQLRTCAQRVIEAASAQEARSVLVAGPEIDVLISDAVLAGDENGFALAQWVRRHRPQIETILTSSIINKAQAASDFCARNRDGAVSDPAALATRIHSMLAERKRRMRPSSNTAAMSVRRKRR